MDIDYLKREKLVLLDCISGSKAYGLDTPKSDVDKRGLFYLEKKQFFTSEKVEHISNLTNDETYTEIGKFFELLIKSNPTMIELLNTPKESVLYRHGLLSSIKLEDYLSKECEFSFAGYAITQIKKAKGLNKKVVNPIEKERKNLLDFCRVPVGASSISLVDYLAKSGKSQKRCGLSKLSGVTGMYALFYSEEEKYKGVMQKENSNEVSVSFIEKGEEPLIYVFFNKDGYSVYCKRYREYWNWVEKRNEERYQNTLSHNKNYDAKNMMHTFRLLEMAFEIATEGEVNVFRRDKSFLMDVRAGTFEYEDLIKQAEEKSFMIKEAFEKSSLPLKPNQKKLKDIL